MLYSPRTQRTPFSLTTTTPPDSPPKTPPRRPSLSHPMTWLTRSSTTGSAHSTNSKQPYTPSKPIRISEPKFTNSLDVLNALRSGPLGTGATVVRTPQEALSGTAVHLTFDGDHHPENDYDDDESEYDDYEEEGDHNSIDLPSPPQSPALLPVPLSNSTPSLLEKTDSTPARPTRAPPPLPPVVPSSPPRRRSSLKMISPPASEYSPPVPPLPRNVASSPPQPPFDPVLVSSIPTSAIDPTKIIVSLETSTTTYRTTLNTLTSRPSHLATYLTSLLPRCKCDSDANSVHSSTSAVSDSPHTPFNTLFHNHLTSSGLLPASTSTIRIFLDRPSAPYAHILSFLRSLPSTPEILPHAVQLTSSSPSRLEGLLELRDEALYLDLKELHKLCTDEIRQRQGLGLHTRDSSGASIGSLHSRHTLRERAEEVSRESHDTAGRVYHTNGANEMGVRSSSYAIPHFTTATRGRSSSRFNSLRSAPHPPPAGWI